MGNILNAVSGYKTYIASGSIILIGIVAGPLGVEIPGVDIGDNWLNYIYAGIFGGTFRSAMKDKFPN